MQLDLTTEQRLLRESSRQLLDAESPLERVRHLAEDPAGFDRALWRKSADLGWFGLLIPEQYGGGCVSDSGLVDLCIVAEELGRTLHPGPFHATNVVAAGLAEFGTSDQREQYLPGIAAGELIATWAFAEDHRPWSADGVSLTAVPSGLGFLLDGTKTCVQDALNADVLLVAALTPDGPTQFLVGTDTPGIVITPLETLDVTRRLSEVRFTEVAVGPDGIVGAVGGAAAAIEHQLQIALAVQCAETNGAADSGFALTVQYSKDRIAFGRPIGSYQALKHRMATHRMNLEGSFAIASYAARAIGERRPDAAIAARVAKAHIGKWNTAILHDCIQLHGGIGMTWDYDLHLYLRRAISNEVLYGSPHEQYLSLVERAEGA